MGLGHSIGDQERVDVCCTCLKMLSKILNLLSSVILNLRV
jgi:hypothetical protein